MMAAGPQKRIPKELAGLTEKPETGIKVELANDNSLLVWKVQLEGPPSTPYAGGTFHLTLTLPENYPFKPPTLNFVTKIYHPNVSNDDKGSMCLGLLRPEQWKPSSKIVDVLRFARQLLVEPNPDDAVEGQIAQEMRDNRAGWEKQAREWTAKYAKGK